MDVSFFVTGVICATIASLGYFMYGTGVRDIITLSLPPVRHQYDSDWVSIESLL